MRILCIALAAVLTGCTTAAADEQTRKIPCANDYETMVSFIGETFGEKHFARGTVNDDVRVDIFVAPGRRTWTVVVSKPEGQSCIAMTGDRFRPGG